MFGANYFGQAYFGQAYPFIPSGYYSIGVALESDVSQVFTWILPIIVNVSQVTETDVGQNFTWIRFVPIGQALENDTSQVFTAFRTLVLVQAVENDTARRIAKINLILNGIRFRSAVTPGASIGEDVTGAIDLSTIRFRDKQSGQV